VSFVRAAAATLMALSLAAPAAKAADSAVILTYYRFGEDKFANTNIKLAEFDAHLKELTSGRYNVAPLLDVLSAIRDGKSLPDRTIAITMDDGFASVYAEAWPRLRAAKLPFTIFVATASIDAKAKGMMSWTQLRELAKAGVTIGAQTASHLHMVEADAARNRDELARSNARIAAEIGTAPVLFSYPYGEASRSVMRQVKEAGYKFAFGQYSGVANPTMDDFFIPRFGVNDASGNLDRFRTVVNALPLKVADVAPADPLIIKPNPPSFGFTVTQDVDHVRSLNCFLANGSRIRTERLDMRIEARFARPLAQGRTRLNCTMPGGDGRVRWFGTSFYVPRSQ
jgi:peptidoglycan/xylan/chitin deacetylase (PgdA/CDA1 family)